MAYCGPRGIRYSEFLGWSDLDRSAALAWQADQDARCGGCGQYRDLWWLHGEDGEVLYDDKGYPKLDYAALTSTDVDDLYCHGCRALAGHRKQHAQGDDDPSAWLHPRISVHPTPPAAPDVGSRG